MATPYGHTLTALAAFRLRRKWSFRMLREPCFYLAVFSASAPDLDFLPGLFMGNEALFHHQAGHSIGAGLLFGLIVLFVGRGASRSWGAAFQAACLGSGLFLVHLVLDSLTHDANRPYGMQLFWPLSGDYYQAPWRIFLQVDRHPFGWGILARAIPGFIMETLVLGPLILLVSLVRRRALD